MLSPTFLDPTENHKRKPPFTIAEITLLKASITMTNNEGDKGSSYPKQRELLEKPIGVPFTRTKKHTKEILRLKECSHEFFLVYLEALCATLLIKKKKKKVLQGNDHRKKWCGNEIQQQSFLFGTMLVQNGE
jgi:hypothetical protein